MFLEGRGMLCLHTVIWAPVTHEAPTQAEEEGGGHTTSWHPDSWHSAHVTGTENTRNMSQISPHSDTRPPGTTHSSHCFRKLLFSRNKEALLFSWQRGRPLTWVQDDAKSVGVSSFMCAALMFWPDLVFILCVFVTETVEITYLIPISGNTASFLWISLLGREE